MTTTKHHLVSQWWTDIPVDLFKIILEKSVDVNAQNEYGITALHYNIWRESKTKGSPNPFIKFNNNQQIYRALGNKYLIIQFWE